MASDRCDFLITDAGAPGLASRKTFNSTDGVDVRDQITETMLHLRADEVQPARHTLYVNGQAFRVLRVLRVLK